METEVAAGAHNNQPANGSDMTAETAFAGEFAATVTAVAVEVAMAAIAATAATAEAQTAAAVTAARETYINKGRKWRSRRIQR